MEETVFPGLLIFVSILLLIVVTFGIVHVLRLSSIKDHLLFATDHTGLPVAQPITGGGFLTPGDVSHEYDVDAALYISDLFSRYYLYMNDDTDKFEERKDMRFVDALGTNTSRAPAAVIIDNPEADAVVVVFRGTVSESEWQYDFMASLQNPSNKLNDASRLVYDLNGNAKMAPPQGMEGESMEKFQERYGDLVLLDDVQRNGDDDEVMFHSGFLEFYCIMRPCLIEIIKNTGRSTVYVAGHSLGAGVTNIFAYDMIMSNMFSVTRLYALTFASPRSGTPGYAKWISDRNVTLHQMRNTSDVVPSIPFSTTPSLTGEKQLFYYQHGGKAHLFSFIGSNLSDAHSMHTYQQYLDETTFVDYITLPDSEKIRP